MNREELIAAVKGAKNLDDLCSALNALQRDLRPADPVSGAEPERIEDVLDITSLRAWGSCPENTDGVWSYDETRLLRLCTYLSTSDYPESIRNVLGYINTQLTEKGTEKLSLLDAIRRAVDEACCLLPHFCMQIVRCPDFGYGVVTATDGASTTPVAWGDEVIAIVRCIDGIETDEETGCFVDADGNEVEWTTEELLARVLDPRTGDPLSAEQIKQIEADEKLVVCSDEDEDEDDEDEWDDEDFDDEDDEDEDEWDEWDDEDEDEDEWDEWDDDDVDNEGPPEG